MKKIFFLIILFFTVYDIQSAPVAVIVYKGKTFYVDIAGYGTELTVWFRDKINAITPNDKKIMVINANRVTLKRGGELICRSKKVYDNGKAFAGCTAVALSGACFVGAVATEGATGIFCSAVFDYTIDKGLKDCVQGIASKIAERASYGREWASLNVGLNLGSNKLKEATLNAIDAACTDR